MKLEQCPECYGMNGIHEPTCSVFGKGNWEQMFGEQIKVKGKYQPKLPKPCTAALVQGLHGSEYRALAKDFTPEFAQYSADQMLEYGKACWRLAFISMQGEKL